MIWLELRPQVCPDHPGPAFLRTPPPGPPAWRGGPPGKGPPCRRTMVKQLLTVLLSFCHCHQPETHSPPHSEQRWLSDFVTRHTAMGAACGVEEAPKTAAKDVPTPTASAPAAPAVPAPVTAAPPKDATVAVIEQNQQDDDAQGRVRRVRRPARYD